MKQKLITALTVLISINCFSETADVVFREPFTLKLPIDEERYYEQEYPQIPYVADNCVYIFPGEEFRVSLQFTDAGIELSYDQNNDNKEYFGFKFWNELKEDEDEVHSFLTGQNGTPYKLAYDALMVVHDSQRPLKTSIIPTESGLKNYEHWPHPIMQLMLHNFRIVGDSHDSSSETPYPQKLYPAIFRIKIDEQGKLTDFGLDKVIDPESGSTDAIDIEIPESYIESARTHVIARNYEPHLENGKPVAFYDYFFYDPKHPDEVISEIKK